MWPHVIIRANYLYINSPEKDCSTSLDVVAQSFTAWFITHTLEVHNETKDTGTRMDSLSEKLTHEVPLWALKRHSNAHDFFLMTLTRAVVDVPTVRLVNGVAPGSVVLMPVMAGGTGVQDSAPRFRASILRLDIE